MTVLQGIMMANDAWESVTQQTLQNCFRKAGFVTPAAPEQPTGDDDVVVLPPCSADDDEDVPLARLQEAFRRLQEAQFPVVGTVEDFLHADTDVATWQEMTDEDIIGSVTSSSAEHAPVSDDEDEDDDAPPPPPSDSEAKACVEVLQQWLISKENGAALLPQLRHLTAILDKCRAAIKKQTCMTDFFEAVEKR